jgi:hypothetical protein
MVALAQWLKVIPVILPTVTLGGDVIDFGRRCCYAFLRALNAQWMGTKEGETQPLPLPIIATLGGTTTLVIILALACALSCTTTATARTTTHNARATRRATGRAGTPGHCFNPSATRRVQAAP